MSLMRPSFYNPPRNPQYNGSSVSPRHEACAIPTQTPGRSKRESAEPRAKLRPGLIPPKDVASRGQGARRCRYSTSTRMQDLIRFFQAEKACTPIDKVDQALTKERSKHKVRS